MEAASASETFVSFYETRRRNILKTVIFKFLTAASTKMKVFWDIIIIIIIISSSTVLVRTLAASHQRFRNLI
jgi:hypothetical protein